MVEMEAELTFVDAAGVAHKVRGETGRSLMRVAVNAGVPGVVAECGGCMTCGTCHVHLEPDVYTRLTPPSDDERCMLEMLPDVDPASRLSCQIRISPALDGAVVFVAAGNGG